MGVVLPKDGYLQYLREITARHDTLLIFDEVITGFRLGLAGAQGHFGIRPDLTCLGKIIGGGFPVGAYGGRKDIMRLLAPEGPVYQAGTLSGNPVAMTAGITTLKILQKPNFYQTLNKKSDVVIDALREVLKKESMQVNSIGSMFTIFCSQNVVENLTQAQASDDKRFAVFYHRLLQKGIYLSPSPLEANFIGSAHTKTDLKKLLLA